MNALTDSLRQTKTITFDCYGTLIDWQTGIAQSLRTLHPTLATGPAGALQDAYERTEAEVEAGGYRSYREIQSIAAERLARQFDVELEPGKAGLLSETLPGWPAFADTSAALVRLKQRHRLGILSNIDRDLLAQTVRQFDITFDFVVTAEDVRSYKPAHGHFERLLAEHGDLDSTLHVAQSLFHDGVPANELGLPFVWINRRGQVNETEAKPLAAFPDLKSFAEVACA